MPTSYVLGLALICSSIWKWGAVEVRGNASEVFLLTVFGFAWLLIAVSLFPWLGISVGDDIIERRNPAALIATPAATLALAAIFAGGNLGEGPSYWNNLFSAALGTSAFFLLWICLELVGRVSSSISEERDLASGIRFAGYALATGLIIARAVAGNWHSEMDTIHDLFRDGWPVALLLGLAAIFEISLRPRRSCPFPSRFACGLLPALFYLLVGVVWIVHLGRWEGMPP